MTTSMRFSRLAHLAGSCCAAFELIAAELDSDPHLKGTAVAEGLRSIDALRFRAY